MSEPRTERSGVSGQFSPLTPLRSVRGSEGSQTNDTMPDLPLHWRSFLVPKDGHALAECEDAIAGDPKLGRFAIADGAAESYASGDWARRLVDAFTKNGPIGNWLAGPRKGW